jgi:4-amino-4-deoxy-L-arabinose transferase-like glycosyltransferase
VSERTDTNTKLTPGPWRWRGVAALLILASAALHVWFIAHCPFDLAPDEAHYWHWSQKLDASYYSKGPLTAYLIRASCELAGDWSRGVCGTEAAAVRLPAVICGSLLLVALYVLTVQCFDREPLAMLVVAAAITMPAVSLSQTLMTIDAPYSCCWGWALVLGHRAIFRNSLASWAALGFVIGAGILAKYTMVLFIASAGSFLLCSSAHRALLRRPGFWIMVGIAGVCSLPIIWWNWQFGWVSLRHVGGQAGLTANESAPPIHLAGPLLYLGGQLGLLFGFWFVVWAAAMIVYRPWRDADPTRRYLWMLSFPQFALFGLFSLRTNVMINWPVTAYLSGLVLAAPWLIDQLAAPRAWVRRWYVGWTAAAIALGTIAVVTAHATDSLRPILTRLAGSATEANALPIRRYDPTCRMRGWQHLGKEVDAMRRELQAEGIEPIVCASRWNMASELAFYCDGRPEVYSFGTALWDRQSQLDLWRPNPVNDEKQFLGRTFIFVDVGILPPAVATAFDKVEKTRKVIYDEDGVPISIWDVTICRGFRGFAHLPIAHF